MSKYGDEGYFDLDKKEALPFLLYILFYDEFEEYHESQNLSLHYDKIIEKIKNNSKYLKFFDKVLQKLILKKVESLSKAKVDIFEFDSLVTEYVDPSPVYSNSIEILEKKMEQENLKRRIFNFKKSKLSKKEFEKLSRQEPLWNVPRAILYISGYKGFEDEISNYECIKGDDNLSKIFSYLISSVKIHELNLIRSTYESEENYKKNVEPQEFIKWARKRGVESPFFKEEVENNTSLAKTHHITPDMRLMFDAIDKFWKDYDLSKPDISKAPFKKNVVDWLIDEAKKRKIDFGKTRAEHIDTIMRCPQARRGGNSF